MNGNGKIKKGTGVPNATRPNQQHQPGPPPADDSLTGLTDWDLFFMHENTATLYREYRAQDGEHAKITRAAHTAMVKLSNEIARRGQKTMTAWQRYKEERIGG